MKKQIILEIFGYLKSKNIVSTEAEFSTDWLGQCESYFRGLRFKNTEPTLGVVAICSSRLLNAADQLGSLPRYHALSQQLRQLGNRCREVVDADSVEFELPG